MARSPISRPLDGAYMYLAKNLVRSESGTYSTLELKIQNEFSKYAERGLVNFKQPQSQHLMYQRITYTV